MFLCLTHGLSLESKADNPKCGCYLITRSNRRIRGPPNRTKLRGWPHDWGLRCWLRVKRHGGSCPSNGWTLGDLPALWAHQQQHQQAQSRRALTVPLRPRVEHSMPGPQHLEQVTCSVCQTLPNGAFPCAPSSAHNLCLHTEVKIVSLLGIIARVPGYPVKLLWSRETNMVCWCEAASLRFYLCPQGEERCRTLHQHLPQTRLLVWSKDCQVCLMGRQEGWN